MIDLRSDTVTRPSAGMRAAMAAAEVGDDVWGDDPTVIHLQETIAARAGKAAGLYFPSGTQSNLAALLSHCDRGDEAIVGLHAHTYWYEAGGMAMFGGIMPQPIENEPDGSIDLGKVASLIKGHGPGLGAHFVRARLLALENTFHGRVVPADYLRAATEFAHARGLGTHLDGARLYNAAVAQGITLADACAGFDTVSICFSKGLGAPVGSALVGSSELIARAFRWRKALGGGMRQAGILAAACLYALEHHVDGLATDHENAARLAAGLAEVPGVAVTECVTNMVFVAVPEDDCAALEAHLAAHGILAPIEPSTRLVTHRDIDAAGIDAVVAAFGAFYR